MRVVIIALTLFFLNLSVVMVSTLDIYSFNIAVEDKWRAEVDAAKTNKFDPDQALQLPFGDFFTGARTFIAMIWRVTLIGETLKLFFGLNCNSNFVSLCAIADTFSFAGMIIYFLGIAQFIAKTPTKGMQ